MEKWAGHAQAQVNYPGEKQVVSTILEQLDANIANTINRIDNVADRIHLVVDRLNGAVPTPALNSKPLDHPHVHTLHARVLELMQHVENLEAAVSRFE